MYWVILLYYYIYWFHCLLKELKGKILLKAKKIGGLEDVIDEAVTDEVSDEEEADGDPESPSAEDPPAEIENDKVKPRIVI